MIGPSFAVRADLTASERFHLLPLSSWPGTWKSA
jgi:hypothetical protein